MAKAAAMLRESGAAVPDVAKDVGYDDVKYFNAIFKQHKGMTADEYKRMQ
jgi:two-component system response regulator YesN